MDRSAIFGLIVEKLGKRPERLGLTAAEVTSDLDLVRSGVLDSLGFVDLITELETAVGRQVELDKAFDRPAATTVGGVVKSGDELVQLVPDGGSIAVEARLSPSDRAEVWPGLPAVVKISAYDYSVYGGLKGKIIEISPDAIQDEKGNSYFRVRLEADAGAFGTDRPVVPGMLADVDILTGRRSILSYLLKPLRTLRDNALRQ